MEMTAMIKSDYCRRLREVEELHARVDQLEYENRMLRMQRDRSRRAVLAGIRENMPANKRERLRLFRRGWLSGMMVSSFLFTAVAYLATH